jgi:hypothetical protein
LKVGLRQVLTTALLSILLFGIATPSNAQTVEHKPVNLSFVYPLSTNSTPDVSTSFRLSLLYGRLHSIRGLDLNLGVSLLHGDMQGLQLTGLYSQIEGDLKGVSLGFGPAYVKGNAQGIQMSVLPNLVMGEFEGFQYSTLFNFLAGDLSGAQATTLFNLNDAGGGFLQFAGVANAVGGDFKGIQAAAGFNFSRAEFSGAQIALTNIAAKMNGLQVGAINLAGAYDGGLQIGALNWVRSHDGIPIGLFNYSEENGSVDWITYAGSLSLINTGVRTTINRYYAMLTVGGNDADAEVEDTAFLTWNFGYQAPLGEKWGLGGDLGMAHIMPKASDDPAVNDKLQFAVQARILGEYQFSPKVAVFAAGGVSWRFSEYSSSADSEVSPLITAGISLF